MTKAGDMQLASGQKVGSYILIDRIGNPNMGEVWRARHELNPKAILALKCVNNRLRHQPQMLERFERECAVQQRLNHPAIVPVRECIEHEGNLFLVMRYIPGGSLEDRLAALNGRPMPVAGALRIALPVLDALNYAHQQGVIHRDVKPSNILLDDGQAYLSDFGVAYLVSARRKTPTDSGGTCWYMSPEQIQATQTDQRSDVYGFGCVLYEMLTGVPPFPGSLQAQASDEQVKRMHLVLDAPSPRSRNADIPPRLERIVLTALAKRPADRFPGCGSFANALAGVIRDGLIPELNQPEQNQKETPKSPNALPVSTKRRVSFMRNFAIFVAGWVLNLGLFGVYLQEGLSQVGAAWLALAGVGLISGIVTLRLLYLGWKAIQDGAVKLTPGAAIGRLFIPVFNIYWLGRAFVGFAKEFNRFAERHQLAARQDTSLYLAVCCLTWASCLLGRFLETEVLISAVQQLVILPAVAWSLTHAINATEGATQSATLNSTPGSAPSTKTGSAQAAAQGSK